MDSGGALALVDRIYQRLASRRGDIDKSERYYEGDQPLTFATAEWKKANAARYSGFSDNWCGTVVNAEAERLKPIGFEMPSGDAGSDLWDQLQMNEFDAQFSQGVVTALTSKRTYVIVWPDGSGDALVSFEHPSYVEVEYDWENPRRRSAALKTWLDDEFEYATLYTPDALWKFRRSRPTQANDSDPLSVQASTVGGDSRAAWEPREVRGETWPLRNPLGVVPVVEIGNRPRLKGEPVSEIAGVMPMQDAINLLWAYLFLAADYASMDARVMLASEPPMIPILDKTTGEIVGRRPVEMADLREKRLLSLTGDNARIDSWEAARLDIFTDTIEIAVGHIAAQTRTPPHYLVTNKGLANLSGDALKSAEIGLTKKASEFITFTDPQIREVARLVALVKGDEKLAHQARLAKVRWESPEIRSEAQLVDALQKKATVGWPFEVLLEEYGKSPKEIKRILEAREREVEAAIGAGVQGAIQDGMNDDGQEDRTGPHPES